MLKRPFGSTTPIIIRKTADEIVNTSVALQNDDHLFFGIAANEIREFTIFLMVESTAAADLKAHVTFPAAATFAYGDGSLHGYEQSDLANGDIWLSCSDQPFKDILMIRGVVSNGVNAGNVQLQWAQRAAIAVDTKVLTNSHIIAFKIG